MKEYGHLGCVGVLETMDQWFNLVPKSPLWLKLSGWWVNMMVEVLAFLLWNFLRRLRMNPDHRPSRVPRQA